MVTATAEIERALTEPVYSWSYTVAGVEPEAAAQEVEALNATYGSVTPEAMVDRARPSDAPLHPAFEWEDSVAAERYRHEQARSLLRRLVVSYRRTDGSMTSPTRYVVKLQARANEDIEDDVLQSATEPHVYIPIRRVMDEPVLRDKYVREAWLSVASWRRRYQDIEEFARIFAVIDRESNKFGKRA